MIDFFDYSDLKSIIVGLVTAALTSIAVYLKRNGRYVRRIISDSFHKINTSTVIDSVNKCLGSEVLVLGSYKKLPIINEGDFKIFGNDIEERSRLKRVWLKEQGLPNDPHAVLSNDVVWADDPLELNVEKIYFSQLSILREDGVYPELISASALMICAESREVLLHRRSQKSATYPMHLHTFGGAYCPAKPRNEGDRGSVRRTVIREVNEEACIAAPINQNDIFFCLKEKKTGFIQFLFIGCCINKFDKEFIKSNYEGNATWIGFDDIEKKMRSDDKIVPSCRAAILLWLGVGAPGAKKDSFFSGKNPQKLFKDLVEMNFYK